MRVRLARSGLAAGLVSALAAGLAPAADGSAATSAAAPAAAPPTRLATPATAADEPDHPVRWLALGDSYSSGEGVDENYGHCARSPGAYAAAAYDTLAMEGYPLEEQDFLACSGAQVPDVTGSVDLVEQIQQATGRYDLITFTIGGNDSGFGDVITDCIIGTCSELADLNLDEFEREYKRRIDGVRPSLTDSYRRLIEELLAPGGHIVVLGYPRLFEASSEWPWYALGGCELVHRVEADMIRRLADHANAMIADAVGQYPGVVHFLDIANAFEGHNLCAGWRTSNEWINGLSVGGGDTNRLFRYQHSFHPNRAGHAAEGELLADLVRDLPWPSRPSATVTLEHGGLTVTSGGQRTVADFGQPPAPAGANVERAISVALGEPMFAVSAAEYGMCAGPVDRFVGWEEKGDESAALIVALTGSGDQTELVGYRSYASSPAITMADGVPIGASAVRLRFAYLLSATRVVVLPTRLDNGAVEFELRGPSPRGPAVGTLTGRNPAAEIVDRGSGEQCGLGSLLSGG